MVELRSIRARTVWGTEHYDDVVRMVIGARRSVWISTANLKEIMVAPQGGSRRSRYHSVLAEFDRLAGEGVELRLLHAGMPSRPFRDEFDRFPRLCKGGLQLRQCARVHMKVVIVDARLVYFGSANWTGAGLGAKGEDRRNFELGLLTDDERIIDEVQDRFAAIWAGGRCRTCRLRDACEAPLDRTLAPRLPRASAAR